MHQDTPCLRAIKEPHPSDDIGKLLGRSYPFNSKPSQVEKGQRKGDSPHSSHRKRERHFACVRRVHEVVSSQNTHHKRNPLLHVTRYGRLRSDTNSLSYSDPGWVESLGSSAMFIGVIK